MGFDLEVSIPVFTVFIQGLLSFLSPCVFPLIPLYIGYLSGGTGVKDEEGVWHYPRGRVLVNTVFFVLGISFTFFLLGLGVSAAGSFFKDYQSIFARVGGILVIALGLYQLGVFGSSKLLGNEHRLPFHLDRMAMSPVTALLMGFSFSFAWTPCVGPALSSVLLMTASAGTRAKGFLMIGVYTLGFVLPFLAVGIFTTSLLKLFRRHMNIVKYTVKLGAVLMLLMGLMMFTGKMNDITGYLSGVGSAGQESVSDDAGNVGDESSQQDGSDGSGRESGQSQEDENGGGSGADTVDFALTDQHGTQHSISDYRGKVIFLNFWATWCSPCRMEMPDIQELYQEYEGMGEEAEVVFLSVATPGIGGEGTREEVIRFMEENGYTYPVLMDETGEVSAMFGISAYPTTYMIDREGKVYGYVSGTLSRENMESIIRQTLEGEN
ncbi:cytochrome c biogenesis protein/redoxin [Lachnoclostridium sp. An118]|uniref:cytochrome c biogenesis protein/redoxin n=1 Tax=Lachnoclostridium sp. An118 TaxID=1965547 RepID=UPI000B3A3297|nr:cytochrome c biogenesis protein/redoxin [Lachnoclostridium sp. An118]OUQ51093.1 cytochrome C biogenesis protein [Lachnoclostridium sp. An118]